MGYPSNIKRKGNFFLFSAYLFVPLQRKYKRKQDEGLQRKGNSRQN